MPPRAPLSDYAPSAPKRLGDVLCSWLVEASGRTLGQAGPERLDRPPNVVDKLRAAPDQRLARADYGHVGLALFAPVLEWIQQFRVHSSQASQVLGVYFICLAFVGVDEPQFA